VSRVAAALALALAAGCNALVGIEPPIADPCYAAGGGGCGGSSNASTGESATCGDGVVDPGEECDGGEGCDHCKVICEGTDAFVDPTSHHCYWVEEDKAPWLEAMKACEDAGGYLGVVTSQAELDAIDDRVSEGDFWLGGGTVGSHQPFGWIDGAPWSFAPWKDDHPPPTDNPACVIVAGDPPHFEAKGCGEDHAYLCERDPPGQGP
jgi:hypothetical protein